MKLENQSEEQLWKYLSDRLEDHLDYYLEDQLHDLIKGQLYNHLSINIMWEYMRRSK